MIWLALSVLLQSPAVEPPAVHTDRSITVTIVASHASTVRVWGDWQEDRAGAPMRRLDDGIWTFTTAPLSPGPHLYAFVVDGLRMADPANRRVKNGFPGVSSIVEIPDPTLANLPTGIVHVHTFINAETKRRGPRMSTRRPVSRRGRVSLCCTCSTDRRTRIVTG